VLRIFSDTCRGCGLTTEEIPVSRESRAIERSETVFALAGGTCSSRLGGLGSDLVKPRDLGSGRMGAVDVRAKPKDRGSIDFMGV
jgi:hypothetical protein